MAEDNESNTTGDGEGESEVSELIEEKLKSTGTGYVQATKSGPGRAWPPEINFYCGVLNCPSTTASCKDLWFYKIPQHSFDSERRAQWLEKIKRPDVEPYHRILVCERHFDPKDIRGWKIGTITSKSRKYLKKGAIPTLHLPATQNVIHVNLHKTPPKHIYKRIHQEVNKTVSHDQPSTSGIQNNYRFKKPKTSKGNLETTKTVKTKKIEPNTLKGELEMTVTVKTEKIEPNTLRGELETTITVKTEKIEPNTLKGELETTITVKTEKIEPNTLKEDPETTVTVKTEIIEPNKLFIEVDVPALSTDESKHRDCSLQKVVEPSPTKTPSTITKLELTEKIKQLCLSSLCTILTSKSLETFINLKLKLGNEPYDDNGKYSDEFKLLILDMYYAYPLCYDVLADTLGLPPPSALKGFIPLFENGLNRYGLQRLVAKLNPKPKYGILCHDIVKTTPHVYYDYERDIINGVNKQAAPYRFAIIAMAQGITAEWHQIVSVYFFHDFIELLSMKKYHSWRNEIILSLEKFGISIIAVVTSTNDFFIHAYSIRELSIQHFTSKNHFFKLNGKKVWHIFDPLHLILCLHDELQDNSFVFNDNCTADWKHVKEFYLQKEKLLGRSCTIKSESSQQDKLESAAAILLDGKTAKGIYQLVDMEILSEEAKHTANFLMILSKTFNHIGTALGMSASTNATPSDNQTAPKKKTISFLKNENKMIKSIMNKNLQFFENLKYCPKSNEQKNGTVIKCLVSSFQNILSIYETKNPEVKSFAEVSEIMSKFNLNPLIKFIHMMKLKNTKLTSELLIESINESLIQNEGQIEMDAFVEYADKLIELDGFHREKPNMSMVMKDHKRYIRYYSVLTHDDGNSLMAVASYLLEKMDQHFRNVVSAKMKLLNSSVSYQRPGVVGYSGTIIIPDDEFLELVITMDTVFIENCKEAMLSGKWFATLKEKISKAIADVRYSGEAATLDFIGDLFLHMRIYHVLKYNKSMYEEDWEHEFAVKRLEGYKLDKKKVKLASLECFRNPEYT